MLTKGVFVADLERVVLPFLGGGGVCCLEVLSLLGTGLLWK